MEASKFLLSGLSLTVCALIFQLVGLASPNWITTNVEGVKIQVGLWKLCAKARKRKWCLEDKDIRGKTNFCDLRLLLFYINLFWYFIFSNSLFSYFFFTIMTIHFFFHWTDWLEPVRATAIVGFISLLFALVLIILKIFVMKDKKNILFVAIGSTFVGGKIYVDNVIHACLKYSNTI